MLNIEFGTAARPRAVLITLQTGQPHSDCMHNRLLTIALNTGQNGVVQYSWILLGIKIESGSKHIATANFYLNSSYF